MLLTKPLGMIKDLAQGTVVVGLTVAGRVARPVTRAVTSAVAARGPGSDAPENRSPTPQAVPRPQAVPTPETSRPQGDPFRPVVAQQAPAKKAATRRSPAQRSAESGTGTSTSTSTGTGTGSATGHPEVEATPADVAHVVSAKKAAARKSPAARTAPQKAATKKAAATSATSPASSAGAATTKKAATKAPAKKTAAQKAPGKKAAAKKTAAPPAPEPLLDPAMTKAVRSESATLARAADPDKG